MEQSTITSGGQTTVPAAVVRRLGLRPGDRLVWDERGGEVVLRPEAGVESVAAVAGMLRGDLQRTSDGDFDAERAVAHAAWAREAVGKGNDAAGAT